MFRFVKKDRRGPLTELLKFIVAGTQSEAQHALVPLGLAKELHKAEAKFITIKSETPDPAGNVPVFATSVGIAAASGKEEGATGSNGAAKMSFEILDGIPVPESKRGGLKGDTYPFESLKVGQSFFVPATEAKPNPAKGLASTVSSANRRYVSVHPATVGKDKRPHPNAGQPTGKDGRKFTVRPSEHKGVKGAQVWRIA